MKHKWLLIALAVIFFLTAVTLYVNRVLFPTVVKKIAIEQAEKFLKRKVEIEDIRFNWLKGVVINKIKVYQKDSPQDILAQAERVSMGFIFVPGLKQHKLTIPNVTVSALSLHLIHKADGQWNFSDLLVPPQPSKDEKPAPVAVSVGGINITEGKIRLDDLAPHGVGTELFDQVNLKVGLSFGGISFDSALTIPKKQGIISLSGAYQPLNQSLKASIHLENIKPGDYLSLVPVQLPITWTSGTIKKIESQVEYSPKIIQIKGSWLLENLNVSASEQNIKATVEASNADILLKDGTTQIKGQYTLNNTAIVTPLISAKGSLLKANVDNFFMKSPEDITLKASLKTQELNLDLGNNQNIRGDLKVSNLNMSKNKKATTLSGNLTLTNLDLRMPGKILKGNLNLSGLNGTLDSQNNVQATGVLDLENFDAEIDHNKLSGAACNLKSFKINFDSSKQLVDAKLQGVLQKINVGLDHDQRLSFNAHLDLQASIPLKEMGSLQYSGSVALQDGGFIGSPVGPISDIQMTADIKNDTADIQSLTLKILDTPVTVSGKVINLTNPLVNIQAQAETFDLSKASLVAPQIFKQYGLTVSGQLDTVKIKFEGMARDPSTAKINGGGVFKNTNIESTTFKQSLKNISGTVKATGDSISWADFTGDYMGKTFTLNGGMTDFKNPKIKTTFSSNDLDFSVAINKTGDTVELEKITGHYLSVDLGAQGTVDLSGKTPVLDVNTKAQFKLEDIGTLMPDLKKTLDPLKIAGLINATANIKGPASDWKNWTSSADIKSDKVALMGLTFTNLAVKLNQSEGQLHDCVINSDAYQGNINIISTVDLNKASLPSDIAIKVSSLDVASIIKDLKMTQDIRGKFNLTGSFKTSLMKPLEVSGKGNLSVLEAYLADIELFRGILSPLKAIIKTSNLILNEVTGNFDVADQKVTTNDFQLKGNIMNLVAKGSVGFDQSLNMSIEVPDEYNQDSALPSDIRQAIHYTVTGTISKPKVNSNFSEIKTIINVGKKILGDKLPEGVSNILSNLPF